MHSLLYKTQRCKELFLDNVIEIAFYDSCILQANRLLIEVCICSTNHSLIQDKEVFEVEEDVRIFTIEEDYTRALFGARANSIVAGTYVVPTATNYTFSVFFDFDANANANTAPGVLNPGPNFSTEFSFPVTVFQDGTIDWSQIPQWVTFFCTNN